MRVLITGGAGFLGRGILRHCYAGYDDWDICVYSRDETKQDECRKIYRDTRYVLGDVCTYSRLWRAMQGMDMVIHAAAIKYIPEAEFNVQSAIDVNVMGTFNVVLAAAQADVPVVFISTDKACSPLNVYGMTKALGERLVGEFSSTNQCTAVRYGNVIGSTGSVIPKFYQQLQNDGYVTLTDPNMTRYWITIKEAIDLIKHAMYDVHAGSIVIPKPRSMRMIELAETIMEDYGATNAPKIVGIRPGEKMHEDLLNKQESIRAFDCGSYYELFKVGSHMSTEQFFCTSNAPQGGWITSGEILDAIMDAQEV